MQDCMQSFFSAYFLFRVRLALCLMPMQLLRHPDAPVDQVSRDRPLARPGGGSSAQASGTGKADTEIERAAAHPAGRNRRAAATLRLRAYRFMLALTPSSGV
jgi:hypothetical protein